MGDGERLVSLSTRDRSLLVMLLDVEALDMCDTEFAGHSHETGIRYITTLRERIQGASDEHAETAEAERDRLRRDVTILRALVDTFESCTNNCAVCQGRAAEVLDLVKLPGGT